jgi:hypothetical protein
MSTPTTALLARTVRLSTRGWGTHATRMVLGVVVLFTLATTTTFSARFGAAGLHLLSSIVWWSALFITLAGIGLFCSAITEEKEEQTIGLLRMAGLRPVAILLAKSTARFYDAVMLFAILLPFTMLAVTLGGVSTTQVLACAVALAAYIFFLANLGLLLSVLRPTTQSASGMMVLVLILFYVVPMFFWSYPLGRLINEATVWFRIQEILTTGYSGGVFSLQLWTSLGLGVGAFIVSLLLFDRCVRDEDAQAPERMSVRGNSRLRLFGVSRAPAGIAAVTWKDFHFACGGRTMSIVKPLLILLLIGIGFIVISMINSRSIFDNIEAKHVGVTIQFVALLWLVFEFAIHLSKLFAQEVRGETLTGLLSLPYTAAELAYAKLRAALLAMLPAMGVLVLGICIAPEEFFKGASEILKESGGWMVIFMIVFFWHACAYLSLVLRRSPLIAALGLVIGIQFLYWMFAAMVMFASMGRSSNGDAALVVLILIYAIPSIFMHIAIARRLVIKGAQ